MARRVREAETRSETSRVAEARRPLKNRYSGVLTIPETIRKQFAAKGMGLHWMAEAVYGEPGAASTALQMRMMNGWTPVSASQVPDLMTIPLPGKEPDVIIRRGGQILMQKPLKEIKADREQLRLENMAELRAIKWADAPQTNEPAMPRIELANQTGISVVETQKRQSGAAFKDED